MSETQAGILAPVPPLARYLTFSLVSDPDRNRVAETLRSLSVGEEIVVGIGRSLVSGLDQRIDGLRSFPSYTGKGFDVPSTPAALWCWLRGDDRGELVHQARRIRGSVSACFRLERTIDAFRYGPGLDLTGYEDGTENPTGDRAVEVAVVRGKGAGMYGSSFVAVLQWVHDLDHFESLAAGERDRVIGRRRSDNRELEDAPASAHVKRTAQESFDPQAFLVRRSMPWADENRQGLVFVSFGNSLDPFEALLKRMVGGEDGIPDALFGFTRPISGSYFWCPPVEGKGLDLRAIGL